MKESLSTDTLETLEVTDLPDEEFFPAKADEYRSLFEALFQDLLSIAKEEPELLDDLYYNREAELHQFREELKRCKVSRGNILVTGGAGVGKSTFVYRVLNHAEFTQKENIVPIFADYRSSFDKDALLLDAVQDISSYLEGSPSVRVGDLAGSRRPREGAAAVVASRCCWHGASGRSRGGGDVRQRSA